MRSHVHVVVWLRALARGRRGAALAGSGSDAARQRRRPRAARAPAAGQEGRHPRGQLAVDIRITWIRRWPTTSSAGSSEYSTCLKLLNYPDAAGAEGSQLVPDGAAAMPTVSTDGMTYTFNIQAGLQVLASLQSGGDRRNVQVRHRARSRTEDAVAGGVRSSSTSRAPQDFSTARPTTCRAWWPTGNTLTITLTEAAPDFLAQLAMPFFCAIPTNTPIDPKGVKSLASAGPYYVESWTPNRSMIIKKNPNYTGDRPAFLDEIDYQMGVEPNQAVLEIKQGNADYVADGIPPRRTHSSGTSRPGQPGRGTDKQQFFVNPILSTSYLAMNTTRPQLRQREGAPGGQLRDRPPGDPRRVGQVRRLDQRSDPAARHGRVQGR